MILHCIESARRHGFFGAPALWSAAAHGTLVVSLVVGRHAVASDGAEPVAREVVFLLPLLPAPQERPVTEALTWQGSGPGVAPDGLDAAVRQAVTGVAVRGGATRPAAPPVPVADSGTGAGSPIYLESELDQAVERDPSSAGPVYPEALRVKGVEGDVVAEWVVDTTGTADVASFRVVQSGDPQFSAAVQAVLPLMRFRPAELGGQRVRQLVRQLFHFRLELQQTAQRDTTVAP